MPLIMKEHMVEKFFKMPFLLALLLITTIVATVIPAFAEENRGDIGLTGPAQRLELNGQFRWIVPTLRVEDEVMDPGSDGRASNGVCDCNLDQGGIFECGVGELCAKTGCTGNNNGCGIVNADRCDGECR